MYYIALNVSRLIVLKPIRRRGGTLHAVERGIAKWERKWLYGWVTSGHVLPIDAEQGSFSAHAATR